MYFKLNRPLLIFEPARELRIVPDGNARGIALAGRGGRGAAEMVWSGPSQTPSRRRLRYFPVLAAVGACASVAAVALVFHDSGHDSAATGTSRPAAPVSSTQPTVGETPPPPATSASNSTTITVALAISDPITHAEIAVSLDGQPVANLTATSTSHDDSADIELSQEGIFSYRLHGTYSYLDDTGATQQMRVNGRGRIAVINGAQYVITSRADGSLSLQQM